MDGPYLTAVRNKFDRQRAKFRLRVSKFFLKPPPARAERVWLALWFNGSSDLTLDAAPSTPQQVIGDRSPFGRLFACDAPHTPERHRPRGFADEKPKMIDFLAAELAAAWPADAPLPARMTLKDMSDPDQVIPPYTGEPLAFDPAANAWVPDDWGLRQRRANRELAELVRPRLAELLGEVAERLGRAVARIPPPAPLRLDMIDISTELCVLARPPGNAAPVRVLSGVMLPRHDEIDWQAHADGGADTWLVVEDELLRLLADAWSGLDSTRAARACRHNGDAEYDLAERRWVRDFLGREVPPP